MNETALQLLNMVISGTADIKKLQAVLGVGTSQFYEQVRKLSRDGLVYRKGSVVFLQKNAKAQLLRRISQKLSLRSLLRGSNESVLCCLAKPSTVDEIVRRTGLSYASAYRTITDFRAAGVVKNSTGSEDDDRIALSNSQDLQSLANILNIELEMRYSEAEIIYHDATKSLKKSPKNQQTSGHLTAFSMFSEYGVEYDDPFDYYVEQEKPADIHDIVIHAVVAAHQANNRAGLLMSVVFYVYNRNRFDTVQLRKTALSWGVNDVWLDIESYVRRRTPEKNSHMFLPWDEFLEKAELYGINSAELAIPAPTGSLFEDVGRYAARRLEVYLLGGENMRIKNLKASTKDCDIVVRDKASFDTAVDILTNNLGYTKLIDAEYTQEDMRLCPDIILTHPNMPRIDVFTSRILNGAVLSDAMIQTADCLEYGNLTVGILRNEYVFLLKAVAGREGDIDDMEILAKDPAGQRIEFDHGRFAWEIVWDEILWQEAASPLSNLLGGIFEQVSQLAEQRAVVLPILDRLRLRTVDHEIARVLRGGRLPLSYLVSILAGGEITAKLVRNRIESLARLGGITKSTIPVAATMAAAADKFLGLSLSDQSRITRHTVRVAAAIADAAINALKMVRVGQNGIIEYAGQSVVAISGSETYFPYRHWRLERKNVDDYLAWRFPLREPSDLLDVDLLVSDLSRQNYQVIADIDAEIARSTGALSDIDGHPPYRLKRVDAAKVCLKIA